MILALVLFLLPIVIVAKKEKEAFWRQTDFWFRDDDGTEISATGYGSSNTQKGVSITSVASGTAFRLRLGIKVTTADGTLRPQLEFKEGTDCTSGSWTTITPTSDTFNLHLSNNFNDGDTTTEQITNGSFVAGKILESTNPASALDLSKNENTEYEWSIEVASNVSPSTTYSFRISNKDASLDDYDVCPTLTTQLSLSPSSSGGSGGGGARPTTVIFSGKVFPEARVFVVDKDVRFERMLNQNIVADENGTFQINFVGILQGQHSFGLVIKDKEGRPTQTKFFNIDTLANDFVVKDIFVPPTVGLPERLVTRGRNATITGYASPDSHVIVEISDIIKKEVKAEKDGLYKMAIETGSLEFGTHYVRVKQVDASQKRESDYSPITTFVVSRLTSPKTDLSGDGAVNIKDWSMFLSRWGSKDASQKKIIDFNDDGKIDIADFSIFIRTIKK